ncbi:MAG: GTPase ObgE, partial [Halofilum sp. (in: g-proteobacteria)]
LDWDGPVHTISAIAGEGTDELCSAIMARLEAIRAETRDRPVDATDEAAGDAIAWPERGDGT